MKLTRVERWILSNQYEILAKLNPKDADLHRKAVEALTCGYELHYEWMAEHIYKDELSEGECQFVLHTMSMFEAIQLAYRRIVDKAGLDAYRVRFLGFDGNNETAHMAYVRFVRSLNRFSDLDVGDDDANSHMPMRDTYRRMLAAWNALEKKYELTRDDLVRLLAIH